VIQCELLTLQIISEKELIVSKSLSGNEMRRDNTPVGNAFRLNLSLSRGAFWTYQ